MITVTGVDGRAYRLVIWCRACYLDYWLVKEDIGGRPLPRDTHCTKCGLGIIEGLDMTVLV